MFGMRAASATGVGLVVGGAWLVYAVQGTSYTKTIPAVVALIGIRKRMEAEELLNSGSDQNVAGRPASMTSWGGDLDVWRTDSKNAADIANHMDMTYRALKGADGSDGGLGALL